LIIATSLKSRPSNECFSLVPLFLANSGFFARFLLRAFLQPARLSHDFLTGKVPREVFMEVLTLLTPLMRMIRLVHPTPKTLPSLSFPNPSPLLPRGLLSPPSASPRPISHPFFSSLDVWLASSDRCKEGASKLETLRPDRTMAYASPLPARVIGSELFQDPPSFPG